MGDIYEHTIQSQVANGSKLLCFSILSKKSTPYSKSELLEFLSKNHNSLAKIKACTGFSSSQFAWGIYAPSVTQLAVFRGTGFSDNINIDNFSFTDTIRKIY